MIDIVGTLTQPLVALSFLLVGLIVGIIGAIVKTIFSPNKKVTLIIGDFISTVILITSYISLSFIKVRGVLYVYTMLMITLGYTLSYFISKLIIGLIIKTIKPKAKKG